MVQNSLKKTGFNLLDAAFWNCIRSIVASLLSITRTKGACYLVWQWWLATQSCHKHWWLCNEPEIRGGDVVIEKCDGTVRWDLEWKAVSKGIRCEVGCKGKKKFNKNQLSEKCIFCRRWRRRFKSSIVGTILANFPGFLFAAYKRQSALNFQGKMKQKTAISFEFPRQNETESENGKGLFQICLQFRCVYLEWLPFKKAKIEESNNQKWIRKVDFLWITLL